MRPGGCARKPSRSVGLQTCAGLETYATREIPAHPPGRSRLIDVIRWFPLADSLHHRLISVAPPARSVRQACSLSTGFLSRLPQNDGKLFLRLHLSKLRDLKLPATDDSSRIAAS